MTDKQQRIINEYEKTRIVHPSYGEISRKTGATKSYVFKTISEYLKRQNNPQRGK